VWGLVSFKHLIHVDGFETIRFKAARHAWGLLAWQFYTWLDDNCTCHFELFFLVGTWVLSFLDVSRRAFSFLFFFFFFFFCNNYLCIEKLKVQFFTTTWLKCFGFKIFVMNHIWWARCGKKRWKQFNN
jgi:hypothetical protein